MKRTVFLTRVAALLLALALILSSCGAITPAAPISLDEVPEYSGKAYVEINGNIPFFTESELSLGIFESFSDLDSLGRCGVAFACIDRSLMPNKDEDRDSLSSVTPSGWEYDGRSNNNKYDFVDGSYIYNRCHLIGFQLTGEQANKKNLITGTRYLNIRGMLPFEDMVADYIRETGGAVLYRVTPIYDGYNLVCDGVLIEGYSVSDGGEDICFCVYSYNVQPGVTINYYTGENYKVGDAPEIDNGNQNEAPQKNLYVVTTSGKYHLPSCRYAESTKEENKTEFSGTLEELIEKYPSHSACGVCLGDK